MPISQSMVKPPSLESIVNSVKALPSSLVDAVRTAPFGSAMLLGYGALLASVFPISEHITSYLTSVFEPGSTALSIAVGVEAGVFSAVGAFLVTKGLRSVKDQIRVRKKLENLLDEYGFNLGTNANPYFQYWCHRQDFMLACRRRGLLDEYREAFQQYKESGKPVDYPWMPNF